MPQTQSQVNFLPKNLAASEQDTLKPISVSEISQKINDPNQNNGTISDDMPDPSERYYRHLASALDDALNL